MNGKVLRLAIASLFCSIVLLGCSTNGENREIDITFDGEDCSASGPEFISEGSLIVDLEMQAEGVAVIYLYRLDAGKTWPQLASHFSQAGKFLLPPDWVTGVSGRDIRGDKYDRQYNLEPGTYGIVCLYMGPDTNGRWAAGSIEVRQNNEY